MMDQNSLAMIKFYAHQAQLQEKLTNLLRLRDKYRADSAEWFKLINKQEIKKHIASTGI